MENQQITAARLKNIRADELITAAFAEEYGERLVLYHELLNTTKMSVSIRKGNNPALWELCTQLFGQDKELQQLIRQKIIHLTLMGLKEGELPCAQETIKEMLNATIILIPSYEHMIFLQYRIELDLAIQEGEESRRLPVKTKMASSLDNLIALTNLLATYGAKKIDLNDKNLYLTNKNDLANYLISVPKAITALDLITTPQFRERLNIYQIVDTFIKTPEHIKKIELFGLLDPSGKKLSLIEEMQQSCERCMQSANVALARNVIKVIKLLGEEEIAQSLQQKLDNLSKGTWSNKPTNPTITPEPEPSSVLGMELK